MLQLIEQHYWLTALAVFIIYAVCSSTQGGQSSSDLATELIVGVIISIVWPISIPLILIGVLFVSLHAGLTQVITLVQDKLEILNQKRVEAKIQKKKKDAYDSFYHKALERLKVIEIPSDRIEQAHKPLDPNRTYMIVEVLAPHNIYNIVSHIYYPNQMRAIATKDALETTYRNVDKHSKEMLKMVIDRYQKEPINPTLFYSFPDRSQEKVECHLVCLIEL